MPRASASLAIDAPPEMVFDIIHDYDCRLEWDTMLSEARLLDDATQAGLGVRSRCVGTWKGAFLPLETAYISYQRGRVAAVSLTNRPPFFEQFAATIRHKPLPDGGSLVTYIYSFQSRPRWLAPLLNPIMNVMLRREVDHRLAALRDYVESRPR